MTGSLVEFPANGTANKGYLAVPDSGSGPGVIVLQEWWGLVPHIQDLCDRFAEEGFVALAPDLYHGESTTSPDDAGRLMMALESDKTEKDLAGTVRHLLAQDAVSGSKVGVIGFCMGGQLALYAASKNPEIGACADFYGIHPNVKPDFGSIGCAVLGIFAEKDEYVNPAVASELEENLKAAGVSTDFTVFPGVDHAFFNDTRADVYNAEAAGKAWSKTLSFLRQSLS